ncbi:MAG TPA: N-acetyltransferase [Ktedonobacterales bacterium]|nr:N-acetyltransferase [Ktedonobacterales bacterium]
MSDQREEHDHPIVVRRATEHDRVAALGLIAPAASRGRASLALLRAGQGMLWVAVEAPTQDAKEEKLVGLLLAAAQIDPETEELVGYIHELLVHPAYRRRGVAMNLLDAAERALLVEGEFSLVYVVTSFENDAAVRLYRSRGYSLSQARFVRRRDSAARAGINADQPNLP